MAKQKKPKQKKPRNATTKMEEKFCHEYLIDYNQRQAAIRSGYSPKNAKVVASKMMSKKKITDRIMAIRDRNGEKHDITVDAIILSLKALRNKCVDAMDGFEIVDGLRVEGKHGPAYAIAAIRANELMGQHIGMWPKKIEIDAKVTVEEKKQVEAKQTFTTLLDGFGARKSGGPDQTPRLVEGGKKKASNA